MTPPALLRLLYVPPLEKIQRRTLKLTTCSSPTARGFSLSPHERSQEICSRRRVIDVGGDERAYFRQCIAFLFVRLHRALTHSAPPHVLITRVSLKQQQFNSILISRTAPPHPPCKMKKKLVCQLPIPFFPFVLALSQIKCHSGEDCACNCVHITFIWTKGDLNALNLTEYIYLSVEVH